MSDEIDIRVEIGADSYGDGRKTVYAGMMINDSIHTDADGPNIEYALLQLIKNLGKEIARLEKELGQS